MRDLSPLVAALFDMDGVVLDSEPESAAVMRQAARDFGFEVPDSAMPSFKGLPGDVVYARVAREFGNGRVDGPTLRAHRDRLYEARLPVIPLVPGIRDVLEALHGRGWPAALVTSSRRAHADRILTQQGLERYFGVVLGSEDVSRPKPDPEPYRLAAARLGVAADTCLAIEDSVNGVRSASAAGCRVVGFGTEFTTDELLRAGAAFVCANHAELLDRLVS